MNNIDIIKGATIIIVSKLRFKFRMDIEPFEVEFDISLFIKNKSIIALK